jgi:hypothetical protein
MTITRRTDWPLMLDDFIARRLREPFVWGRHDCALFAADAVLAITGHDFAAGMRGKSAKAALRFLRVSGGLDEIVCDALGPMCGATQVRIGDVVMAQAGKGRLGLAVVLGERLAVAPGPTGLMAIPLSAALCGWTVG